MRVKIIFLGIISAVIGFLLSLNKFKTSTYAKVKKSTCRKIHNRHNCDIDVVYTVDNVKYTNKLFNIKQKLPLVKGDKIVLFYDKINPNNIQYGFVQLAVAFILMAIGGFIVYKFFLCDIKLSIFS